jgi:hypothetical protein
LKVCGEPG